jgi:hypothetical protein
MDRIPEDYPYVRINYFSETIEDYNKVWKTSETEFKNIEEKMVSKECIMIAKKMRSLDIINRQ